MRHDASALPAPTVSEDEGFLLASLAPCETGLPMTTWLCVRQQEGQAPYMRASSAYGWPPPNAELATVMIDHPLRVLHGRVGKADLRLIGAWLHLNRDVVADYWMGEADAFGLVQRLKRLPG